MAEVLLPETEGLFVKHLKIAYPLLALVAGLIVYIWHGTVSNIEHLATTVSELSVTVGSLKTAVEDLKHDRYLR